MQGVWIRFLVGELRFCMPNGMRGKKKKKKKKEKKVKNIICMDQKMPSWLGSTRGNW